MKTAACTSLGQYIDLSVWVSIKSINSLFSCLGSAEVVVTPAKSPGGGTLISMEKVAAASPLRTNASPVTDGPYQGLVVSKGPPQGKALRAFWYLLLINSLISSIYFLDVDCVH